MAGPLYYDRVLQASTTTGVGTYTLATTVTGHQPFSVVGDGNTCYYCAFDVDSDGNPSGGWEVGLGTYAASGTTLARTSVSASSNSGSAVSWAAGTRRIALVLPASVLPMTTNPAGSNTQVQFNDSGVFAGSSGLVYDKTAHALTITGKLTTPEIDSTGDLTLKPGSGITKAIGANFGFGLAFGDLTNAFGALWWSATTFDQAHAAVVTSGNDSIFGGYNSSALAVNNASLMLNAGGLLALTGASGQVSDFINVNSFGNTGGDVARLDNAGNFSVRGNLVATNNVFGGALRSSSDIYWLSKSVMDSPVDGNILFTNQAGTSFGLLQGGGTTNAFPAWKRNGAGWDARLADDSGYTNVTLKKLIATGSANQNNPAIYTNASDTLGFSDKGAGFNTIGVVTGGAIIAAFDGNAASLSMMSGAFLGFSATAVGAGWPASPTVALGYNAPGVVEINNGTAGTFRDLVLRNITVNGTATVTSYVNTADLYAGRALIGAGAAANVQVTSPSSGVLVLKDQAGAGFSALSLGLSGGVTSTMIIEKAIGSIADATFTDVFTVTIPNAAHSATIRVRLSGSSGAGGAVGANESTQDAEYMINVTRTAGVAAVASIGAVVGQAAAVTVAGGNSIATTAQLSSISGAVGATNTFTIQVKVARSGGTATNHTCLAFAELLNANATGITIS